MVSFDGLGQQIVDEDPAAVELRHLMELRKRGWQADGVRPAFPSTTANSHAAIWAGAYGNQNGIAGNANPVLPRSEHTFLERRVGFRSESLLAEPLWVSAARQGVRVVAHQVTQVYPFTEFSAGTALEQPPVVLNSYQTHKAADYRVLRAKDVDSLPEIRWDPPLPKSISPGKHFAWNAGPVRFVATLCSRKRKGSYDAMVIAQHPNGPRVLVVLRGTETRWPRGRKLAQYFSDPLMLDETAGTAELGPLSVVFRLWEASSDGDFLLLSTPLQELGIAHGKPVQTQTAIEMLRQLGPLPGNGPSSAYLTGAFGSPVNDGGDGTAELRFLETMELITRQYNRYSRWLWDRYRPQLLIDYFPFPDEMDHGWLGLSRERGDANINARSARFLEFRKRGYQMVDERVRVLAELAKKGKAVLALTSDHGMAPVARNVNINAALREVGYLVLDEKGDVDAKRSRAVGDYAILLNTADWKDGIVPLEDKGKTIEDLSARLGALTDAATGTRIFASFYTEAKDGDELGIGGPAGFDLYFDLAPGYAPDRKVTGPVVEALDVPRGRHGFFPLRKDMQAVFIAAGGGLGQGTAWTTVRSTQIAPTVAKWLGIASPATAKEAPISVSPAEARPRGR